MTSSIATYEPTRLSKFLDAMSFSFVKNQPVLSELMAEDDISTSSVRNYAVGVASLSILIMSILLLWGLTLLVYQCCKRNPPFAEIKGLKNKNNMWVVTRRLTFLRLIFFTFCGCAIASVALFDINGVFAFRRSLDAYDSASHEAGEELKALARSLENATDSVNELLDSITPLTTIQTTCQSAVDAQLGALGVTLDIPSGVADALDEATLSGSELSTDNLQSGLLSAADSMDDVERNLQKYRNNDIYIWLAFSLATFIGVLVLPFLVAVLKAIRGSASTRGCLNCFLTKGILPTINFFLFVFILVNVVFGILASLGNDVCGKDVGGPDDFLKVSAKKKKKERKQNKTKQNKKRGLSTSQV